LRVEPRRRFVCAESHAVGADPRIEQPRGFECRFESGTPARVDVLAKIDELPQRRAGRFGARCGVARVRHGRSVVATFVQSLAFGLELFALAAGRVVARCDLLPARRVPLARVALRDRKRELRGVLGFGAQHPIVQCAQRLVGVETQLDQSCAMRMPVVDECLCRPLGSEVGAVASFDGLLELGLALSLRVLAQRERGDGRAQRFVPSSQQRDLLAARRGACLQCRDSGVEIAHGENGQSID